MASENHATTILSLGALVRHGERAATIWGVTCGEQPNYLLFYYDRSMKCPVSPDELELLAHGPSDDVVRRLAMSNPRTEL